jgi:ubiquinone/menaquinone biosynthesis C-methylase UbiE
MTTSNAPLSDYVQDVVYPDHFHREIMPLWLCSALQALGRRAPDLCQPFTWLELGCGTGVSAVIAAATHPQGTFIGIDINAAAIVQAQALAQAAGLRNVQFICASFEEALNDPAHVLPACEFVVSHGVYSWVSPEIRRVMQQLVQRLLKPGGVLYMAYMSQPGSASMAAAQKLAQLYASSHALDTIAQTHQALNLLQRTAQAGTGYFAEHARMTSAVDQLARMDERYVAHEFLNVHWDSLHVADVMADMQSVDCDFIGSATLLENVDGASLPVGAQALFQELLRQGNHCALLETFKDIARNQNQRRDLYQRQHPQGNTLNAQTHRQQLLAQRVCLLPHAPDLQTPLGAHLTLDTRIGPVEMPMEHVQPLLQLLQQGPCTYTQLLSIPLYGRQPGLVSQLLQLLCWAGWLQFLHVDAPDSDSLQRTTALNQALAQRPCGQPGQTYAAAVAAGTAIPVPLVPLTAQQRQRMSWLGMSSTLP